MGGCMSANYTVREYDATEGTYTARRDIPPLWVDRPSRWRRLVEAVKRWQYQDGPGGPKGE